MSTLQQRLEDMATRIATEFNDVRGVVLADLAALGTLAGAAGLKVGRVYAIEAELLLAVATTASDYLLYGQHPFELIVAVSDEATALTAGTAKVTFRMPRAVLLDQVRASLSTAQTGGSILTVDVNEGGASIFSTTLTIDNGEKTSVSAATPAVLTDADLAEDAEMTIDIDQVGDGTAKGLKVALLGWRAL